MKLHVVIFQNTVILTLIAVRIWKKTLKYRQTDTSFEDGKMDERGEEIFFVQ